MRIAVLLEASPGERRVALSPDAASRLVKAGHEVRLEEGAGAGAAFPDGAYAAAGARLSPRAEALEGADVLATVQRPGEEDVARLPPGAAVVGLLRPHLGGALFRSMAARGVVALALERLPRVTRAQPMDALSSQASIAGYKAVILGAAALPRILPMMTTAAGSLPPARALVVGAGVAGLQAIATARRLGAVVSAFDVRPAAKEQVQSLGASFVEAPVSAEGAGGYARELAAGEQERVRAALEGALRQSDLVLTTAQVPGRPAPRLVSTATIRAMRPGSVVVDLAAETGGNCEPTRPGETVVEGGVSVIGAVNLAATVPHDASLTYGRNVSSLLLHLARDGRLALDPADEIAGPALVVFGGEVRAP